jgi:hypothetical protein
MANERARRLRSDSTIPERELWQFLRTLDAHGLRRASWSKSMVATTICLMGGAVIENVISIRTIKDLEFYDFKM